MATSTALSTSNQYVKYTIEVIQNSQSIASNTSNVTVKVRFYRTNTGYTTYGTGTVYCKINGTTYSAGVTSSQKITSSGIVLFTKTLDIQHGNDGTKSLVCSAWISHNAPLTSSEQSYSQTLDTIPRKSTLSASNGTLGTAQTLTVSRKSTAFTHTITYKCEDTSGTICTKSSSTSISWIPPVSLASQNTTGTAVTIALTITTYNGDTSIGSNTYTITCSIPTSVKPTVSIAVSDPTGYLGTYGGYVQSRSKAKVVATASGSYGSTITAYKTTVDGKTHIGATAQTDALVGSGELTVTTTVTDSRGRTASASKTITVLAYSAPRITDFTLIRCDAEGTAAKSGAYLKAVFSAAVSSLNSKNTASYTIKYKKVSESNYTSATLTDYANKHSVADGQYIFPAETSSSYDVVFVAADAFASATRSTNGSSAKKVISILAKGLGIAFGKVAELSDYLEVAFKARFYKDVKIDGDITLDGDLAFNGTKVSGGIYGLWETESIPANSDLNDYVTPGVYGIVGNATAKTISNMPAQISSVAGKLLVYTSMGAADKLSDGVYRYIAQEYIPLNPENPAFKRRINTDGDNNIIYGSWYPASGIDYIVEQGTSGNWTYRKWYSGIAECWYRGNVTFPTTTTGAGVDGFYVNYKDLTMPITFAGNAMATCSIAWLYSEWVQCHAWSATVRVRKFANTNGTNNATNGISIDVKGRWR